MTGQVIDRYTGAIRSASMTSSRLFVEQAVLDATVPHWRFVVKGGAAVEAELAKWYGHPGTFEELVRTPLPNGELVEFLLTWAEHGLPHASHQVHKLQVRGDRIGALTVWCGGRWPASLLAEMEASRARD